LNFVITVAKFVVVVVVIGRVVQQLNGFAVIVEKLGAPPVAFRAVVGFDADQGNLKPVQMFRLFLNLDLVPYGGSLERTVAKFAIVLGDGSSASLSLSLSLSLS
jgi:hypothetical protein